MKAPDIPDYVSPIVGYRVWHSDATGLRSPNGEPWFPGRALTAKCNLLERFPGLLEWFPDLAAKFKGHTTEPPADDCTCGVYAAKNYQHLQKIADIGYGVYGEVYLWGKVVEHDLGYRAQFAYPKSLVLPFNIDPRLEPFRLELLIAYGADIFLPPNILFWTRSSGYTPVGFDWLIEKHKRRLRDGARAGPFLPRQTRTWPPNARF